MRSLGSRSATELTPPEMQGVFDIMVSAPAAVDQESFELWLNGSSVEKTARTRLAKIDDGEALVYGDMHGESFVLGLAVQETRDHFRMYEMLESYLCQPMLLGQQTICPLGPDMQRVLVEK